MTELRIVDCWSSMGSLLKIVPELTLGVVEGSILEKLVLILLLEPDAFVSVSGVVTLARET